jgi:hypothetical protein
MWFQGLNDSDFTSNFGSIIGLATETPAGGPIGSNSRAEDLYSLCAYGATFTLVVGNKPMLNAPLWYIPAGGGPSGFTTENSRHVITNGLATQEAILKLAKDIPIVVRQNFSVTIDFFPFTRTGTAANGGTLNVDLDPLLYLNQFDGAKLVQVHLDGVETRKKYVAASRLAA